MRVKQLGRAFVRAFGASEKMEGTADAPAMPKPEYRKEKPRLANDRISNIFDMDLEGRGLLYYSERKTFYAISQIIDELAKEGIVLRLFPQVAFIELFKDKSSELFKNLASMRCDFCLCDSEFNVLAVIEVQGDGHTFKGNDNVKELACRKIGVYFYSVYAPNNVSVADLRNDAEENLFFHLRLPKPAKNQTPSVQHYIAADWSIYEFQNTCWHSKCEKETAFFAVVVGDKSLCCDRPDLGDAKIVAVEEAALGYVDYLSPEASEVIRSIAPTYRMDNTKKRDSPYYINHCVHCGIIQNDTFMRGNYDQLNLDRLTCKHKTDVPLIATAGGDIALAILCSEDEGHSSKTLNPA